jgi:hypothetical protein
VRAAPHWVLRWSRPGYALALALLVVAPLLSPGYLLLRDAVSTPRSYLSDSALGLVAAPRATPQDFAIALASRCIDGGLVVKALLVVGLWLAGWGAARLVAQVLPESGAGGEFSAITLAIWNPYVGERLLQGHWSLLLGYGCLPWVATNMLTLRSSEKATWPSTFGLAFWIALAGLTPTGLLLAATVGLALRHDRNGRCGSSGATVVDGSGTGSVVDGSCVGSSARYCRVRGTGRARSGHTRQSGQPGGNLER